MLKAAQSLTKFDIFNEFETVEVTKRLSKTFYNTYPTLSNKFSSLTKGQKNKGKTQEHRNKGTTKEQRNKGTKEQWNKGKRNKGTREQRI